MGCDIHSYAERKTNSKYKIVGGLHPFNWRSYGLFGFLADVRNYSQVPPIAEQRGLPVDTSQTVIKDYKNSCDYHSASWLTVQELDEFNYDAKMEDRRVTKQIRPNIWDGGCTAEIGGGKETTFREFLGEEFFSEIQKLKDLDVYRIIFYFDN